MGLSQNEDGWTIATHSVAATSASGYDSRIIYVSESGNDGTALTYVQDDPNWDDDIGTDDDPFNPTGTVMPYLTLSAAMGQLRDGYPDWVLFKKGDTWTDQQFGYVELSGYSEQERMLMGAYGSGARPLIKPSHSNSALQTRSTDPISHWAFIGIEFYPYTRVPHTADFRGTPQWTGGISLMGPFANVLIEDVKIQYFTTGLTAQGSSSSPGTNLEVRRVVIANGIGPINSNGMFVSYTDGLLIEDGVFDHNGWYGDRDIGGAYLGINFTGGTYTHSTRTLSSTGKFAGYTWASGDKVWLEGGNIAHDAYDVESADDDNGIILAVDAGLTQDSIADVSCYETYVTAQHTFYITSYNQMDTYTRDERPHIIVRNNIITRSGSPAITFRSGGTIENNLILESATSLDMGGGTAPNTVGIDLLAKNNVILNGVTSNSSGGFSWAVRGSNMRNLDVYDNLIAHKTTASTASVEAFSYTGDGVSAQRVNQHHNTVYEYIEGAVKRGVGVTWDWTEEYNKYWDASSVPWTVIGTNQNSEDLTFPDPARQITTYMTHLGGTATLAAFIAEACLQSRDNWRDEYYAPTVNEWIRTGYGMGTSKGAAPTIVAALL